MGDCSTSDHQELTEDEQSKAKQVSSVLIPTYLGQMSFYHHYSNSVY